MFSVDNEEVIDVSINSNADEEVVSWLEELESIKFISSENPVEEVTDGNTSLAVVVADNFTEALATNEKPVIELHGDPISTKASTVMDKITVLLSSKKEILVGNTLQEQGVDVSSLEPFTINQLSLSPEDDATSSYMVSIFAQLIIVLAVIMGGLPASTDLFAGEKERKTMEALIMTPVKRINIVTGKWLTISTLGAMSGVFSVITFVVFVQLFTTQMKSAMQLDQNLPFFVTSLCIGIFSFAFLIAAIEMLLSMIAKTVKEAQNYLSPISMLGMVPYFILLMVSPHELTNLHFLVPIVNIFALIKQLIAGIYEISSIVMVLGSSAVFILLIFTAATFMFKKSKWVLGDS